MNQPNCEHLNLGSLRMVVFPMDSWENQDPRAGMRVCAIPCLLTPSQASKASGEISLNANGLSLNLPSFPWRRKSWTKEKWDQEGWVDSAKDLGGQK